MKYLDLTLPSPEENLACDEALLDACDHEDGGEILRFWKPLTYFVVLGYSNPVKTEVNLNACRKNSIPFLRRPSGGGTVLQGPGCLNFSLLLNIKKNTRLSNILSTNQFVLEKNKAALQPLLRRTVEIQGVSDLTINGMKFSGNAQRRKRWAVLFHGTLLCHFDLPLISRYLLMPSRRPDYRQERGHLDFVMNLGENTVLIQEALKREWRADEKFSEVPFHQIRRLAETKYSLKAWNEKF